MLRTNYKFQKRGERIFQRFIEGLGKARTEKLPQISIIFAVHSPICSQVYTSFSAYILFIPLVGFVLQGYSFIPILEATSLLTQTHHTNNTFLWPPRRHHNKNEIQRVYKRHLHILDEENHTSFFLLPKFRKLQAQVYWTLGISLVIMENKDYRR